jgi:hypothetical protein
MDSALSPRTVMLSADYALFVARLWKLMLWPPEVDIKLIAGCTYPVDDCP